MAVTQIDFVDGRQFRFMEYAPGLTALDEIGPVGVMPTMRRFDVRRSSLVEVFRNILPNTEPPAILVRAEARRGTAQPPAQADVPPYDTEKADEPTDALEQTSSADALVPKAIDDSLCSADWFRQNLCATGMLLNWKTCITYQTAQANFQRNDVNTGESVTCVYQGSVKYRVRIQPWWTWDTVVNNTIQAGYYRWYLEYNSIDFDFETHNTPNAGAGFHYSGFSSRLVLDTIRPLYHNPYDY